MPYYNAPMPESRNGAPNRRRTSLAAVCGLALLAASSHGAVFFSVEAAGQPDGDRPPNIVIITADDLGWGDLGSYGHPNIRTPHLDRMAAEGQRWTSFYSQAPVCSPSRAALLTGRIHLRSGLFGRRQGVFFPDSRGGLPADEITLAEALRDAGYATGIVGKWHLGHLPEHLPTRHGFDSWLGIPYSNDMDWQVPSGPDRRAAMFDPRVDYWHVPLMRDEAVVERPADQHTVTRRYAEEAVSFIEAHRDGPFFLYLPHTMPHMPLFRSEGFRDRSTAGVYGDVIEEIDWAVGQVLETLDRLELAERTLVVFHERQRPVDQLRDPRRVGRTAAARQGDDLRGRHAGARPVPVAGDDCARGDAGHRVGDGPVHDRPRPRRRRGARRQAHRRRRPEPGAAGHGAAPA